MNQLVFTIGQECSDDIRDALILFKQQQDADIFYLLIDAEDNKICMHFYSTSQEQCLISCYIQHDLADMLNEYNEFENQILIRFKGKTIENLLSVFNTQQNNRVKLSIYEQNGIKYIKANCFNRLKDVKTGQEAQYYIHHVSCPLDGVIVQPDISTYIQTLGALSIGLKSMRGFQELKDIKSFEECKGGLGPILSFRSQKNFRKYEELSNETDQKLIQLVMRSFISINNVPYVFSATYKHPGQLLPAETATFIAQHFGPQCTTSDYEQILGKMQSQANRGGGKTDLLARRPSGGGRMAMKCDNGGMYVVVDAEFRASGGGGGYEDSIRPKNLTFSNSITQSHFSQANFHSFLPDAPLKLLNWAGKAEAVRSCIIVPEAVAADILIRFRAGNMCSADAPDSHFVLQRKVGTQCHFQIRVPAVSLLFHIDFRNFNEIEMKKLLQENIGGQGYDNAGNQGGINSNNINMQYRGLNNGEHTNACEDFPVDDQQFVPIQINKRQTLFQFNRTNVEPRTRSLNSLDYADADLVGSAINSVPGRNVVQGSIQINPRQSQMQQSYKTSQFGLEVPELAGSSPMNWEQDILSLINSDTDDLNVEFQ